MSLVDLGFDVTLVHKHLLLVGYVAIGGRCGRDSSYVYLIPGFNYTNLERVHWQPVGKKCTVVRER
jgi:hypothetical protein